MDAIQAALLQAQDHLRAGRPREATLLLEQAAQRERGDARPCRALALACMQGGDTDGALNWMRQAHERAPGAADLAAQYGSLLAYSGAFREAVGPLARAVALAPADPSTLYLLGLARLRSSQALEALPPLRRARQLAPDDVRIRAALAEAEFIAGFPEDALPLLRERHRHDPANLDTILKLGETLSRLGEHGEALAHYAAALARGAAPADLHMALAQAREDQGDRDGAARDYRSALGLRPDWAFPLAGLLDVLRGKADDALIADARRLLADPATGDADRALLGYALGKVEDARGHHADALAAWTAANEARRRVAGPHDPARLPALRDRIIAASPPATPRPRAAAGTGMRPVFIVGMPRSGTTLTEQILASHPQVHGCGELPHVALIARHLPQMAASDRPWQELARTAPAEVIAAARDRYLAGARRHAPAGALRLVDKAPLNFFQLDLVARMFPEALVVWCRRDPRDVAVSIYAENFALEESFATDMAGIGQLIGVQNAIMQHWLATSPLPIHTLRYEALVQDLEAEARKLVDFVGLPWDDACLDFHRNDRGVQTPSRWQVRQPAHTRSVGRWRHYAETMPPLIEALPADALD